MFQSASARGTGFLPYWRLFIIVWSVQYRGILSPNNKIFLNIKILIRWFNRWKYKSYY